MKLPIKDIPLDKWFHYGKYKAIKLSPHPEPDVATGKKYYIIKLYEGDQYQFPFTADGDTECEVIDIVNGN